jgi:hypothetical protein
MSGTSSCEVETLVEVYDDVDSMIWTSSNANSLYSSFFDASQTPEGPSAVITPDAGVFTAMKTVQVRVIYTAKYSQVTNNRIIDQFPVTVMPTGFDLDCKSVTLTKTEIANFSLDVLSAAGS